MPNSQLLNRTATHPPRYLTLLALLPLIAALWLTTRPYPGLNNDAQFYTLQVLRNLYPARYAGDLYFQYGSQDQFTLFTPFFTPFVRALGVTPANIIVVLAGQSLWLCGLYYLARGLFASRRDCTLAIIAVIILQFHVVFFDSGEAFLTPRLIAEAISLWALGSLVRDRPLVCLLLIMTAMLMHPLMGLAALGVLFVHQALKQPIWWAFAGFVSLIALALAFAGIQPFARLFVTFDAGWLQPTFQRDAFCFVGNWGFDIWPPIASSLALGILGLLAAGPALRSLIASTVIVGFGGIAISYAGGDLLKNVLIMDTQLWRAIWPFSIVTYLAVPVIWQRLPWRGDMMFLQARFYLVLTFIYLAIATFIPQMWLIAPPFAVIAAALGIYELNSTRALHPVAGIAALSAVFILIPMSVFGVWIAAITPMSGFSSRLLHLALAVIILLLIKAILEPSSLPGLKSPALRVATAVAALTASGLIWDDRPAFSKLVESSAPNESLTSLLPPGQIYWDGDADVPWFYLRRASYFSCQQGTGVLFSRGTAITYQARLKMFQPLDSLDFNTPEMCPPPSKADQKPLTAGNLAILCRTATGLAAFISPRDIIGAARKDWIAPVAFGYIDPIAEPPRLIETRRFHIYNCADQKPP
jgi:hypothetical protein